MPTFDQLKSTFANRDMSPAVSEHYSFYLRGIINAALPDFMSPLTRTVTEDGVSGEFLEALRLTASTLYPDMQDGDVKQITYDDLMEVLGGVSIFDKDDRYNIETVGERIRTSLGNFGLTKEDGQYVVFDTYDFEPTDSSLTDAAGQLFSEGVYPAARTIGGMIMPENADGSSRDDAFKIRIRIPNEPSTIDVDYDDDPPEGAQDMVLRGPMTNKRKNIWDSFTSMFISEANAGEFDTGFGLLGDNDSNVSAFNQGYRTMTEDEVNSLTAGQRKVYDEIVANKNIAAVPKDKPRNTLMNNNLRLREFDSVSYREVERGVYDSAKSRDKARREAEDVSMAYKNYNTELNMPIPKPKPSRNSKPETRS